MTPVEQSIATFISNEILHDGFGGKFGPDSLLLEEGILDSVGLQHLVTFLEAEFSIRVDDDYLLPENFETVHAVAGLVDQLRGVSTV